MFYTYYHDDNDDNDIVLPEEYFQKCKYPRTASKYLVVIEEMRKFENEIYMIWGIHALQQKKLFLIFSLVISMCVIPASNFPFHSSCIPNSLRKSSPENIPLY